MPNGSPNPRTPATARGEATRRRLLDAAESLFGRNGFYNTSVVEITREAGVGHGTFYLYFEGKEDAFRQLVHHLSRELRGATRRATEGIEDRLEVEEAGARAFFSFAVEHRDLYKIVREAEFVDPDLSVWYYRRLAEGYAQGLERAMEAGDLRRYDADTLAYCLMGMLHMLGMRWAVWDGREPPAEAIDTLLGFVRAGLRPAEEAVAGDA